MAEDEKGNIFNISGAAKIKSKARANADLVNRSNAVSTFEQLKQISEQMHGIYRSLQEEGVDANEFVDKMQSMSDRLNRTLYEAEEAIRASQALQRVKEIENREYELKKENDELRSKNQEAIIKLENTLLRSFKSMDTMREYRTLHGLQDTLDKLLIIYPNMTVSMLKVFITVCLSPGLTLSDYCNKTGMARSTVSRHLLHLGPKINTKKAKITTQQEAAKKYDFIDRGHDIEGEGQSFTKGLDLILYGKSSDNISNFYAPSEKGKSLLKVIKENIYKSLHAIYSNALDSPRG